MRRRLTGDAGINSNRGHNPRKLSGEQKQSLTVHMRSRPGITLAQAQAWRLAEHGVQLGTGATWNAVHRLGLSFKKSAARSRAGSTRRRHEAQAIKSGAAVHRP